MRIPRNTTRDSVELGFLRWHRGWWRRRDYLTHRDWTTQRNSRRRDW